MGNHKLNKKISPVSFLVISITFLAAIVLTQGYLKHRGVALLPGAGGEFTLQSESGPVSLSDFRGKVVALYFGYMSCPDICPTSLWNLSEAIKMLRPEQAERVQGIFISLDPDRDSLEALEIFVKGFHDSFIAVTGSRENLDQVARQYNVVYQKVALNDSTLGYVINHSSVIYLVDDKGVLQYFIPHNSAAQEIRDDLLKLLR